MQTNYENQIVKIKLGEKELGLDIGKIKNKRLLVFAGILIFLLSNPLIYKKVTDAAENAFYKGFELAGYAQEIPEQVTRVVKKTDQNVQKGVRDMIIGNQDKIKSKRAHDMKKKLKDNNLSDTLEISDRY